MHKNVPVLTCCGKAILWQPEADAEFGLASCEACGRDFVYTEKRLA
jgi:hypothetical protein